VADAGALLEVEDLQVHFPLRGSFGARLVGKNSGSVQAVDGVSFSVARGEVLGIVGESGSGKTTLGRALLRLVDPTSGSIRLEGEDVSALRERDVRAMRRKVQMVFQDPYGALNPLHTVGYTVARPCQNFLGMSAGEASRRVNELLETVGLTPAEQFAPKLPHQLSGGQRQRVVIARALACDPDLIVADEPVSMLDVSLRAGVLRLLAKLRADRGLSLLYITHDLLSARVVTDEILVLHSGGLVESGATKDVLQHPKDPYTTHLLDAVPNPFARATSA
jgi:peptide/nickel transport system ATP-binding protein